MVVNKPASIPVSGYETAISVICRYISCCIRFPLSLLLLIDSFPCISHTVPLSTNVNEKKSRLRVLVKKKRILYLFLFYRFNAILYCEYLYPQFT